MSEIILIIIDLTIDFSFDSFFLINRIISFKFFISSNVSIFFFFSFSFLLSFSFSSSSYLSDITIHLYPFSVNLISKIPLFEIVSNFLSAYTSLSNFFWYISIISRILLEIFLIISISFSIVFFSFFWFFCFLSSFMFLFISYVSEIKSDKSRNKFSLFFVFSFNVSFKIIISTNCSISNWVINWLWAGSINSERFLISSSFFSLIKVINCSFWNNSFKSSS